MPGMAGLVRAAVPLPVDAVDAVIDAILLKLVAHHFLLAGHNP
jgi:hypothetical protein